jgi:hypothetical protein
MAAMFVRALSPFLIALVSLGSQSPQPDTKELFAAARAGDAACVIMSTPAISGSMMFIRTVGHVYAVGEK